MSCIGSPIGKSPVDEPIEKVVDELNRIIDIAKMVGTDRVRVFSFYPEVDGTQAERLEQSISRLRVLADLASEHDIVLLLENEGGLVGDVPQRCAALVEGVGSSNLRYVWDTGNYPQMGFANSVDIGWPLLSEHTVCVQVKDCRIADGTITVAGDGDGQVRELLENLRNAKYQGFLALEPHLLVAGQRGGFSGAEGMQMAAEALRGLVGDLEVRRSSPK